MKLGSYALDFSLEHRIASTRWCRQVGWGCTLGLALGMSQGQAIAQERTISSPKDILSGSLNCPVRPVLERLRQHKVQPRETLTQIANRYGLVSATIMGMNPAVRNGQVTPGQTLIISPYNGIVVSLASGQSLQTTAQAYKVKPDILFEVNGCQRRPKTVFVPGVNWSPVNTSFSANPTLPTQSAALDPFLRQDHYPLPQLTEVIRAYGWQPNGPQNKIIFASGVDLAATPNTPVYAVAEGTVAFAGMQKPWGNMVVINHARGRQTRYGYLGDLRVKVGQRVRRGQAIAAIGSSASSALRFELRYRSRLGWIAQDPQPYLRSISGSKQLQSF
jgi:murein DD-endopeptidase MepM/ murein hydrolase activator NlpD